MGLSQVSLQKLKAGQNYEKKKKKKLEGTQRFLVKTIFHKKNNNKQLVRDQPMSTESIYIAKSLMEQSGGSCQFKRTVMIVTECHNAPWKPRSV